MESSFKIKKNRFASLCGVPGWQAADFSASMAMAQALRAKLADAQAAAAATRAADAERTVGALQATFEERRAQFDAAVGEVRGRKSVGRAYVWVT
jgi:hypothetical protein